MDESDPSHGGEQQNGPAAEEEPAHSEQDNSPFQTPGTVNSRRGTQSGLPNSPSATILKDHELAGELPAVPIEHSRSCNIVQAQICSMADPAFLTSKYKEALLASGSLPEPEPISSDDLANTNLDINRAEYPIFQLASLSLKQEVEENAKSAGVYATIKILAVCIVVLLVTALGANAPPKDFALFAHYAQQNDSMGSGVNKQIFRTVESVGYLGASNISLVRGEITTFGAAGLYHLSSPSVTTWHDAESLS